MYKCIHASNKKHNIIQINITLQRSITLEWIGYLFQRLDSIYNSGDVEYM